MAFSDNFKAACKPLLSRVRPPSPELASPRRTTRSSEKGKPSHPASAPLAYVRLSEESQRARPVVGTSTSSGSRRSLPPPLFHLSEAGRSTGETVDAHAPTGLVLNDPEAEGLYFSLLTSSSR
jgi:hypothetical protein